MVASVLARLRNHAKAGGTPFQQVLQQYAIERFLYRISKSKHAESVVLKGALLLKTIGIPTARPTMDIDMLRRGKADQVTLMGLVRDCAVLEVEPDGLMFLADSVVAEEITKDSEYKGTRILMDARMDNVHLRIQVDFGVGDVMGDANSRMKDFYDVWICSQHLDFNGGTLRQAVDATFKNRETPVPDSEVDALTTRFVEDHRVQWNAFVKKIGESGLADGLDKIVADLERFALPLLYSLARNEKLTRQWKAGKGWVDS